MYDRVSQNPGRVLITPEDGSGAFYATLAMADNPTVVGTPLNKASLLTDATAALYGLSGSAVPDDVLEKARSLITTAQNTANGKTSIVYGTYTGDGNPSQNINLGFQPKAVLSMRPDGSTYISGSPPYYYGGLALPGNPVVAKSAQGSQNVISINSSGFTVYYATKIGSYVAYIEANREGFTSFYVAWR